MNEKYLFQFDMYFFFSFLVYYHIAVDRGRGTSASGFPFNINSAAKRDRSLHKCLWCRLYWPFEGRRDTEEGAKLLLLLCCESELLKVPCLTAGRACQNMILRGLSVSGNYAFVMCFCFLGSFDFIFFWFLFKHGDCVMCTSGTVTPTSVFRILMNFHCPCNDLGG